MQSGRGRGILTYAKDLRKPGLAKSSEATLVKNLISNENKADFNEMLSLVKKEVTSENSLKEFVKEFVDTGIKSAECSEVTGSIAACMRHFHIGNCKFRSLLLDQIQSEYTERENVAASDRPRLVGTVVLLSEIFYQMKTDVGSHPTVLAAPIMTYLSIIVKGHIVNSGADEKELILISKQILKSGPMIARSLPKETCNLLRDLSKVLCSRTLGAETKLYLVAVLASIWPTISDTFNPKSAYSELAFEIGISFNV